MTPNNEPHDVTQLLKNWNDGDEDVSARLMPLVYEELRRLARGYLQRERSDHTLQATALVHEAYLRLVDHARAHNAAKRGGLNQKLELDEARDLARDEPLDLVALDGALQGLAHAYPRKSEVVELKFFGGLETKEISRMLEISEKTVLRDWNFAKLWLCRALSEDAA